MEVGLQHTMDFLVERKHLASSLGSGELDVLGTPALLAFIEECCWRALASGISDEETSVGTLTDFTHLKPSPLGANVQCRVELVEVDRRRVVFQVEAVDDQGKICQGKLERFIVNRDKFMGKVIQGEGTL